MKGKGGRGFQSYVNPTNMINSIKIKKLFGRFDYSIKLKDGGITIITGPNGYGKSTILKMIEALGNGDIIYFSRLEYESIEFYFVKGKKIVFTKNENELRIDGLGIPVGNSMPKGHYREMNLRRTMPWIRRKSIDTWIDLRTDTEVSNDEIDLYLLLCADDNDFMSGNIKDEKKINDLKEKINDIRAKCGTVCSISEQRLIRKDVNRHNDEEQVVDVISELPQKLKKEMGVAVEEYSKVANGLDSSYPKRLFAAKDGIKDEEEYHNQLDQANEKFEKLNTYKLVDISLIDQQKYNGSYSTALKIYFDDFSKKYKVFESLIAKLDLFTRIINDRLTFKKLIISRENGFEIVDELTPDKPLDLCRLSSGEKQEVVLFYELIFETNSPLLLIDEPEISLHILWQKQFLSDLIDVAKISSINVIVATHSPQIISNHWDIQIDLGELYECEKLNKK